MGKIALECHKSLKEGLGTRAAAKETVSLMGKQFESDDDISTAVTASLHHQSKG
jgi:hypothetical protein